MTAPLLSACLIVKNEEASLSRCLGSLTGVSDELVVVDTGSTDRSREIAREHGAVLFEHPWQGDYAAARNAGLERARGRFILVVDADEELVADDRAPLRAVLVAGEHDVVNMRLVSPLAGGTKVAVERYPRVFRAYPDARFCYRIHEQIWPSLAPHAPRVLDSPFRLLHHGYDQPEPVLRRKRERNLETALAVLAAEPDNAYYLYHAGFALLTLGQPAQAVGWLERALALTLPGLGRVPLLNAIAQARYDGGQPEQALARLEQSTALCDAQHYGWALRADILLRADRHEEAIEALERCLAVGESALFSDVAPPPAILWMKLGLCQLFTRRAEAAEASLRQALALGLDDAEQRRTAERYLAMATRLRGA